MLTYSKPFLLSNQGSDRATAYTFSNKSVTLHGKTHVVWTDAIAFTRGRTFDHATQSWGETIAIGEGTDNHNTPSLTVDAQGRLRIAYGPHGTYQPYPDQFPAGSFKFTVADGPNTFAGLEKKSGHFGYAGTYACLLNMVDGRDAIVYRGGEAPYSLIIQQTGPLGGWTHARELMRQAIDPQYTHWAAHIGSGRDGALYVAGHFYGGKRAHSLGVAILRSVDGGATWTDLSGRATQTPIVYEKRFAVPHGPADLDPRIEGLDVDAKGRPWVLTSVMSPRGRMMPLSCWENGSWRTIDLTTFMPADRSPSAGGLCVDTAGRIHVVCNTYHTVTVNAMETPGWWSHPTLEVAHMVSTDEGRTFSYQQISQSDDAAPNWLPTISRSGPFHPVEKPVILYTHGLTGQHTNPANPCRPTTTTEVYCVMVEG